MEAKLTGLITDIATLIFHVSFFAAVAMGCAGGLYWTLSGGNMHHNETARRWITNAAIGLGITILSSAFVSFLALHLGVAPAIPNPS